MTTKSSLFLHDFHPSIDDLYHEVLNGLQQPQKTLPTKLLYDEQGSKLFDQITTLDEYYPTRTEIAIMKQYIGEMGQVLGENTLLLEYGSGSSLKTKILLEHVPNLAGYVPVDISKEHLLQSAEMLRGLYPHIPILPVCADYHHPFSIPRPTRNISHNVIYFPGSTIGNFHSKQAIRFLKQAAYICGENGGLLIGVDLEKDRATLNAAYNDRKGITAAFNLNILHHVNRILETNFDINNFEHHAFYNNDIGRIEMHLVCLSEHQVQLGKNVISFQKGETIRTESSYKYTIPKFQNLVKQAGFVPVKVWTDDQSLFSVHYLVLSEKK